MGQDDNIVLTPGSDEAMEQAYQQARDTFKFFWREISWERRRIMPGLELCMIKYGFENNSDDGPSHEHMWVRDIDYDGETLYGTLGNDPQWVQGLKSGDEVSVPFSGLSDWVYATRGRAYGGFTINAMRATMSAGERKQHDQMWGLEFGDPNEVEVIYQPDESAGKKKGGLFGFFKKPDTKIPQADLMDKEHPMCINMVPSLAEEMGKSNAIQEYRDGRGNSMLHLDALAGNALAVEAMLENGFDRNLKNEKGQTALEMAKILDWQNVIKVMGN